MDYLAQAQKDMGLAQTMVQSGIYPNIDDALKEIKRKKEEDAKEQASQTVEQAPQEAAAQSTEPKINEIENAAEKSALIKRVAKVEQVLQDFGKFFVEYKNMMEANMKELHKDFMALQSKMSDMKSPQPSLQELHQNSDSSASQPEKKKEEYNPRQGNVTSSDVKIEDFFSNANGRMDKLNK